MYFCANSDLLSEMFNKHEVPEEYQLVFFYKNLLNDCIKEFFTDVPFDFQKTKDFPELFDDIPYDEAFPAKWYAKVKNMKSR